MNEIQSIEITNYVSELCQEANFDLGEDVILALQEAIKAESSPTAIDVLKQIIENANIAKSERVPMCQDCGVAVFFVEIGQDVHIVGGDINEAINEISIIETSSRIIISASMRFSALRVK